MGPTCQRQREGERRAGPLAGCCAARRAVDIRGPRPNYLEFPFSFIQMLFCFSNLISKMIFELNQIISEQFIKICFRKLIKFRTSLYHTCLSNNLIKTNIIRSTNKTLWNYNLFKLIIKFLFSPYVI